MNRTHPSDMTSEVAFADEISEHCLIDRGTTPTSRRASGDKRVHQIRRHDYVAYAQ
jgi:hypothetical protein